MRLNSILAAVSLTLSLLFASATQQKTEERINFIQFKQISLENLFDYLSARYNVNIIIEEPMIRYYTSSIRLKDVTVEEVIAIAAKEYDLHYRKKDGNFYVSTRKKYHQQNYNTQKYTTRSVKIEYASITDVISLLKDVMHGTVVIRSSTQNDPYKNLFNGSPNLEKIDAKSASKQSGGSIDEGIFPSAENAQGDNSQNSNQVGGMGMTGAMNPMAMMSMMGVQEQIPDKILYVVPFVNENMIYLLSKDEELIKEAQHYIMEVDQPIKEVLIQGKIINIGIDDGFSSFFEFNRRSRDLEGLSANPISVVNIGNLQYSFLDSLTNMNIEILQNEGKAKTIASPMLLTANRNRATLDLVEDVSIIKGWTAGTVTQVEGGGAVSVPPTPEYETENIGTQFEIIPYINGDDEILLKIKITVSTLKPGSQQILVPNASGSYETKQLDGVSRTTIETTLITSHGKGIILGGLINEKISKEENKVPILGDIPILGFPFKDIKDVTSKSETVVVLTPFITDLKNPDAKKMLSKTKKSLKDEHNILDDNTTVTGVKLLDNVLNVDVTGMIREHKETTLKEEKTEDKQKILDFLSEEK